MSRVPPVTAVSVVLGDTLILTLRFVGRNGRPVSRAGSMWLGQVRLNPAVDPVEASFTFDTSLAADGVVLAILAAADVQALGVVDTYYWDIQETDPSGYLLTRAGGSLVAVQDVSRVP